MSKSENATKDNWKNLEGLVHHQAKVLWNMTNRIVPLEDLVQYGFVGLMEAQRRFNPERGVKFSTFAYYRIRGAMLDGLRKISGLPKSQLMHLRVQRQLVDCLEEMLSSPIDQGNSETIWHQLQQLLADLQSSFMLIMALYPSEEENNSVENEASNNQLYARIRQLIKSLPPREQELIHRVYYEGENLAEAARAMKMSRSWACRMNRRILHWLRSRLESTPLQGDDSTSPTFQVR